MEQFSVLNYTNDNDNSEFGFPLLSDKTGADKYLMESDGQLLKLDRAGGWNTIFLQFRLLTKPLGWGRYIEQDFKGSRCSINLCISYCLTGTTFVHVRCLVMKLFLTVRTKIFGNMIKIVFFKNLFLFKIYIFIFLYYFNILILKII